MSNTAEKKALDANLVNALIRATSEVMLTMANTEVKVKEVKPQHGYTSGGDISAVITIIGEGGEGMVGLSFPLDLASTVISRLIGCKPEEISKDDRSDGIGELANMISGNTKTTLSAESNSTYKLSLPSIILGTDHEITGPFKDCPNLLILFEAEGKPFRLQVSFKFH